MMFWLGSEGEAMHEAAVAEAERNRINRERAKTREFAEEIAKLQGISVNHLCIKVGIDPASLEPVS